MKWRNYTRNRLVLEIGTVFDVWREKIQLDLTKHSESRKSWSRICTHRRASLMNQENALEIRRIRTWFPLSAHNFNITTCCLSRSFIPGNRVTTHSSLSVLWVAIKHHETFTLYNSRAILSSILLYLPKQFAFLWCVYFNENEGRRLQHNATLTYV